MKKTVSSILTVGVLWLTLCLPLLSGCTFMLKVKDMTPDQKLAAILATYNKEFTSYMTTCGFIKLADGSWSKVKEVTLSTEMIDILRVKHKALVQMEQTITLYRVFVTAGTMPPAELEAQITALLGG